MTPPLEKQKSSGWFRSKREMRSNHVELITYVVIAGACFAFAALTFNNGVFIVLMGAFALTAILRLAIRW